ncbi:MAG: hypothetical protein KKG75_00580 [Nanoarchaeota archaeon]|nr:hypothetical protein [Nanoarchaeota archaeon]
MKKGEFALSNVAGLLLVLLAALVLILFIYLLRDKIKEMIDIMKSIFGL